MHLAIVWDASCHGADVCGLSENPSWQGEHASCHDEHASGMVRKHIDDSQPAFHQCDLHETF